MKSDDEIKKIAVRTIKDEADAISSLSKFIDKEFIYCVKLIYNSTGRVIVTGIGKSANIASKIVATLNSTGTAAVFMHAADAIHGDLGIIRQNDIIICLSKSGNTPEIKVLIPLIKMTGNKIIGIVGNHNSYLATQADYFINSTVDREACPNNLAPTSSTTAQLVIGDALAVCLLECKGFTTSDFAKYHPGGTLGKKLYLRVSDLYIKHEVPKVNFNDNIKSVIIEISSKRLGTAAVLENEKLIGVITDGDLRRMLETNPSFENLTAIDIMTANPKTIEKETLAVDALSIMRENNITSVLVVENNKYLGVIHLHDLLQEGFF